MITVFVCALLFSLPLMAGDDEEDVRDLPTRERIYVGGYVGFQVSDINMMVNISPMISYRLTNRLTSGVGLTYQYYRESSILGDFTFSTHIYGAQVFTRYSITRQFFAQVEYDALNLESNQLGVANQDDESRFWEHNYFVGGGYRAPLSSRAFLNLLVLYNLNSNSAVYFQNPVLRVGVDVRL